jgi:NADPH-dependent ferric siderophore reductase
MLHDDTRHHEHPDRRTHGPTNTRTDDNERKEPMHGEVIDKVQLSPTMVRIVLGGDGLDGYTPTPYTDQYVNALFVPDGAPYAAPFDEEAAYGGPAEHRPRGRRYTIRSWNPERRHVTIDFVVHGDVGYAGQWANRAEPGDVLQFVGPHGAYAPDSDADWHLMVGDESALPAIAASLEAVRPGIPAVAVIVVDGPENEQPLDSPGELTVRWVHRVGGDGATQLVDAIAGISFLPGKLDLFVHGEASEIRAVRKYLVAEHDVERRGSSISPYWRRGATDETWREEKAAFVAEMNAD